MRAAVEQVCIARVLPHAAGAHAPKHGGERGRAIGHRYVDHLAFTRSPGMDDTSQKTKSQIKRATAIIANQIERRCGWLPLPACRP